MRVTNPSAAVNSTTPLDFRASGLYGLHDLALNAGREAVAGQFVKLVEVLVQGFRAEGHIGDSGVFHAKGHVAAGIVAFVAEAVQPRKQASSPLTSQLPAATFIPAPMSVRRACVRRVGVLEESGLGTV